MQPQRGGIEGVVPDLAHDPGRDTVSPPGQPATLGDQLEAVLRAAGCSAAIRRAVRAIVTRQVAALVGADTPRVPPGGGYPAATVLAWAEGYNKAKREIRDRLAREF